MGIDLKQHGKDSYLGQSHGVSSDLRANKTLYEDVLQAIKALPWQDLTIAPSSGNYYIVLPQPILTKILELRHKDNDLAAKLGQWYPIDGSYGVHMRVDENTNRSHFPGGIPNSMRGLGLGYKCYRRLLEYKTWLTSNTSGTQEKNNAWASMIKKRPDPDDVNAIVGPGNVLAMIKSLSDARKIEIAKNFIDRIILPKASTITDTNFAIDDELKAILPAEMLQILDPSHREELKRQQKEAEKRQSRERTEAELVQNQSLYPQFGITQLRQDFRPGEFVIRATILNSTTARPRIVARVGDSLKAVSIRNYIEMSQNINYNPNEARDLDESWSNLDITAIPDVNNVRLDDTEVAYVNILRQMNRTSAPAPHTDQAREIAVRTMRRHEVQIQDINYGPQISVYDQEGYRTIIQSRGLRPESVTKLKQVGFIKEIYLTQAQYARYTQGKSSEVFAGFNGTTIHMLSTQHNNPQKAINTLTGFVIETPDRKGFVAKFKPIELRSKNDIRQNDMVYIASHPEFYGLTGKVSYKTRHSETGQELVGVIIYNPALQGAQFRKVAMPIHFIRKLRMIA